MRGKLSKMANVTVFCAYLLMPRMIKLNFPTKPLLSGVRATYFDIRGVNNIG